MAKKAVAKVKKASKASTKNSPATSVDRPTPIKKRRLKQPKYKTLRLQKRIKHPVEIANVWQLTKRTAIIFWRHKWLFLGITLVYGVLNIILSQSLSNGADVAGLKEDLKDVFTGNWAAFASSLSIFVLLIDSASSTTDPTAAVYRLLLGLIVSLAVIWALRQVMAGVRIKVKDAYYKGMYPLIPFVLVLMVIGLQLVPLVVATTLYDLIITNGIAVLSAEKFAWALFCSLLGLLSLYMLCSSLFALYIVTLPDMTPLKALRTARELVRHRRWSVLRKILFLPLLLMVLGALIMLPVILWLTPLTLIIFFFLSMFVIVSVHGYMYVLYRELLNE